MDQQEIPVAFVSRTVFTSVAGYDPLSASVTGKGGGDEVLVWVKRMIPPFEIRRKVEQAAKTPPIEPSGPRVLHPGEKGKSKTDDGGDQNGKNGRVVMRLVWTRNRDVLENHVLLIGSGGLRKELGLDGVGDLVSYVFLFSPIPSSSLTRHDTMKGDGTYIVRTHTVLCNNLILSNFLFTGAYVRPSLLLSLSTSLQISDSCY